MPRRIFLSDITIQRNGSNSGYSLSFREKVELVQLLDRLGISVIEVAPITNGKSDSLLIKTICSSVKESTIAVQIDVSDPLSIEKSWESIKDAVHPRLQVSIPVSTVQMEYFYHKKPEAILGLISEKVSSCAALCSDVEFLARDFTRSDEAFLRQALDTAVAAGATTVTIGDSTGEMFPSVLKGKIETIRGWLPENIKLGLFCSNELFMADTCAVAAIQAGADEIKTMPYSNSTVSLGRFSAILAAKAEELGITTGIRTTEMKRGIDKIRRMCKNSFSKAPTASDSVHDGSGINLYAADNMGTVLNAVNKLGYELDEEDCRKVHETVVRLAETNGSVGEKELDAIVASVAFQVPPTYKLESFVINSGNVIKATCNIRLTKGDSVLENVSVGDGPVDAAFLAIEKVVGMHYELDDFQIKSVTEGREAMGETVVRLRSNGKIYSGRGISTDIVGSSIMAYLNAINKIAYEEEQA